MLDKDSINNEISVGVTFASLMAAISLFFTGILVAGYSSLGPSIKVPMLFLIVSTFSFIFAATIYSNAGSEVTLGKIKTVEKYMVYATNIVEFLGLYPLIISMPMVIGAITEDSFLRISTIVVATVGMVLYSQSRFSILEKQLTNAHKVLYTVVVAVLALSLFGAQVAYQTEGVQLYSLIAVILLVVLLAPTVYFSSRSNQYRVVRVRPFKDEDAQALAKLAEDMLRQPQRGKRRHRQQTANLQASNSEAEVLQLAAGQKLLVATVGHDRVGYISLSEDKITAILTDTRIRRKGVGRALVDAAEAVAADFGYETIEAHAFKPNDAFFAKLGYAPVGDDGNGQVILRKEI